MSAAPDACQLSYSLQSTPAVLQVSVPGAASSMAVLTLTIFNNTQAAVTVDAIVVTLPVGTDAGSLVADVSSIVPTAAPSSQWTANAPSFGEVGPTASFTILPQSGASAPLAAGAAIILTLDGVAINTATGAAAIAIDETTAAGEASTSITVTKYPPGFFFRNLLVNTVNGAALQPVAQVAYNTNVTLSWEVSAIDPSAVAIFYSSNTGQQGPVSPTLLDQSAPIALVADTNFTVIVTTTAEGGEPVVAALTASVSVARPDVVLNQVQAQTLTVANASALQGAVTAGAGAAVTGGLTADTLKTTGLATLSAAAAVTGGFTTDSLGATGPVGMFGNITALSPGDLTAPTDGLVIGLVGAPGDSSQVCIAWLSITSGNACAACTGGNVQCGISGNNFYIGSNNNSCTLPVAKGQPFTVSFSQGQRNTAAATCSVWWVPLGTSSTIGDQASGSAVDVVTLATQQTFHRATG